MECKYYGVVSDGLSLTLRTGPGTQHEISSADQLKSGTVFPIYDITYIGTSTWASTDNGFVKIQEGRTVYAKIQQADEPSLLSMDALDTDRVYKYRNKAEYSTSHNMTTDGVDIYTNTYSVNGSMRLFGLPYQFTDIVDHRYPSCSPVVGREFAEKFFGDGLMMYVIPGKASFMAKKSNSKKRVTSHALINAANGDLKPLQDVLEKENVTKNMRLYDFQEDYTSYMHYVNIMCRTVAAFLELPDTIEVDGNPVTFQKYDWRNYRWNQDKYTSATGNVTRSVLRSFASQLSALKSGVTGSTETSKSKRQISLDTGGSTHSIDLDQLGTSSNFVMFYADPSVNLTESGSNQTSSSQIESAVSSSGDKMKEISWVLNSTGTASELNKIADAVEGSATGEMLSGIADGLINSTGAIGSALSSILSVSSGVFKGENLVLPKIYDQSVFNRSYSVTFHFRTPYGNKLAVFTDVIVPTLHCLALALPKSSSPNTYGSPFLIKAYIPGLWNINLGIVSDIEIAKVRNEDAFSSDGLPMEIDVTLTIEDLYPRLTMSPSNAPIEFLNNSSMIEYLATVAGLNLLQPRLSTKVEMILNTAKTGIGDIGTNVSAFFTDRIEQSFSGLLNL